MQQRFGLQMVLEPASEPVTLQELKAQLRVDGSAEDAYLNSLEVAARVDLENRTNRAFVTQTRRLWLDRFPQTGGIYMWCQQGVYTEPGYGGEIRLPMSPLTSVSNIKYIDTDGTLQTLASTEYKVDAISEPARIVPAWGKFWPSTRAEPNAVQVEYVCGQAAALVPAGLKQAILLLAGHWYENREASAPADALPQMVEAALERLTWQWRVFL
jgi:uncharacterized phiE125 gp8 family phage protein